jgi:threonine dehydrogenase-like Zn-dependent dehydrogenase
MRAVRHADAGIVVATVPEPDPDALAVRVSSSGICGSDLHLLAWGALPFTLGHEVGGVLDDGTPVAVWPARPCGWCDRCLAGAPTQCRTGTATGYGVGADGGMADAIAVDPQNVFPLPAGLSASDGALVEPIACSVHAFRRAGVTRGDRVAVVGAGSIGLGAAAVARWMDCTVDVAARHPVQRSAAGVIGAGSEPSGEYDVVVDAAGTASAVRRCFSLLRPGGTVVLVASYWEPVEFPQFFTMKEPTIVTATVHGEAEEGHDMAAAAQLLADMSEVPGALITHRLPLDRAPEAFRIAADRAAGAIKVVLEP